MNPEARFVVPDEVIARTVGDEVVLLDLRSGVYYSLDGVGASAWPLLAAGRSSGEVCSALLADYEVEPEVLYADLEKLLVDMQGRELLRLSA